MITFDDMLNEQMKDEEFRKEYEAIKPEMDAIRKIVDSRISEKCTPDKITKLPEVNCAQETTKNK